MSDLDELDLPVVTAGEPVEVVAERIRRDVDALLAALTPRRPA